MLLYHLRQEHLNRVGHDLDQMRTTEDIATVAAQAYEVVKDHQPEDDERRNT
jgi:hypothetical protein